MSLGTIFYLSIYLLTDTFFTMNSTTVNVGVQVFLQYIHLTFQNIPAKKKKKMPVRMFKNRDSNSEES